MDQYELYESPLVTRNATREMSRLFGPRNRVLTWRRLWVALAQAQHELGLGVTMAQVRALKKGMDRIDFKLAARYEKKLRHDVMAHVHAFGDVAGVAKPIIHLGATSAFVVDNADLIIMRDALEQIAHWLAAVIHELGKFARKHRSLPTLGWTHYQPAQLTTVGKRATLWCWDFAQDLQEIETRIDRLRFRGVRGATGTQASFLALFDGVESKVQRLERLVARRFDFSQCEPVTGQTYSRKVDAACAATLAGVAQSVHKMANDIRLLCNLGEIEEPFEKKQIGSSAMPHKRNPMRMERATGLARLVLSLATSPQMTACEQWFERTLDDSANKRVSIPELFLATDGMLRLVHNVCGGLVVYPQVIRRRVDENLPFLATEQLMLTAAGAGHDRQKMHERLRRLARKAADDLKNGADRNPLVDMLRRDAVFGNLDIESALDPSAHIGLAPQQVDAFIKDVVEPVRRRYRKWLRPDAALNV